MKMEVLHLREKELIVINVFCNHEDITGKEITRHLLEKVRQKKERYTFRKYTPC